MTTLEDLPPDFEPTFLFNAKKKLNTETSHFKFKVASLFLQGREIGIEADTSGPLQSPPAVSLGVLEPLETVDLILAKSPID